MGRLGQSMPNFNARGTQFRLSVEKLCQKDFSKSWLSKKAWELVVEKMSIPCVDMIFQHCNGSILFGWRLIKPYNNVWALPGGRMLRGESLVRCASRIGDEYGLSFKELYLTGVFPINFGWRSDVPTCLTARQVSGTPCVDGFEFSKFSWRHIPPSRTGKNYCRMVSRWMKISSSRKFLDLNRLL